MKFFLFILLLLSNVSLAGEFDNLRSDNYWKSPPDVFVCNNTSINKAIVEQAVSFWVNQGFKINSKVGLKDCNGPLIVGQIIITYFEQGQNRESFNAADHSYNFKIDTTRRAYSKIFIKPSLRNEVDIFKHEIGHSLGLKDSYNNHESVMTHSKSY
jgi:hypothetical protein